MALGLDGISFISDYHLMFVRLVHKKNDHVSIRIVENIRKDGKVKQKTVCCVGHFHKEKHKDIENHKRFGEELIIKIKNEKRPTLPGFEKIVHAPRKRNKKEKSKDFDICSSRLKEEARIRTGIKDIYSHEYKQLGLFETINTGYKTEEANEILEDMVLSRIDNPTSKRKSVANIERTQNKKIDLDSVYRIMDKLQDREDWVKDKIAKRTLGLFKEKINVAFFDVTTLYFESFIPDELRISGYSKDNKVKETQVVFALMTTVGGLPLGYELFPGNTYEGGTLISAVDNLCKRYEVEDVSIVADRAMFTKENLKALDDRKINFIISAKLKKMRKDMVEKILSDVEKKVKEKGDGLSSWSGEYEHDGRRLVVGYSKKRALKDRSDRNRLLERVKKRLKKGKVKVSDLIKNTGTKKYLKFDTGNKETAQLDEEKIKRSERWDGIYGIVSSHEKSQVGGDELFERYKGLWQVEEAFRVNKHDLKMRPIYHWTSKRIKGHLLICYMAYALTAVIRYRLKKANVNLSIERIREELGYIQASIVRDESSGKRFLLPSRINDIQRAIYNALNLGPQEKVRSLD